MRVQALDRGRLSAADVEDAAVVAYRRQHRRGHVLDVDEVPLLQAVAEDRRRLAAQHPLEKDRDDATLEARVLPRPVDVSEAEGDVGSGIQTVPGREVLLAS